MVWWLAAAARGGVAAVLWWALLGGRLGTLDQVAGLVAVLGSVAASLWLLPPEPGRVRPVPVLRLLGSFFHSTVAGSLDVARRAFRPGPPVFPGMIRLPVELESRLARAVLRTLVSLVPGTLLVADHGREVTLHLLDSSPAGEAHARASVAHLERLIAAARVRR